VKSVKITMGCYKEHLDGFARYAELADAVEKWLHATYLKHALSTAPGAGVYYTAKEHVRLLATFPSPLHIEN
jgi:hypothetical protein